MELIFIVLNLPFLALGGLLAIYMLLLTLSALLINRAKKPVCKNKKKFAVIIPAHNEHKVIQNTIQSAKSLQYPSDMFDVIVVADNCTDDTASIAITNGAIVFERIDDEKRGKGFALNWIVPQVLGRLSRYDACVFIDADSVVSPDFLEQMNSSLQEGHQVIQGSYLVLENWSSWRVQVATVALALQNYVRPLGKASLGFSTSLKGNGMCFASDLLRTIRWDGSSLTEDLDMGLELIRREVRVHFNPKAVVHAVMPASPSNATTQRMRWEGGRFTTIRHKLLPLLKEAWKKKSIHILEAAADLVFPPLVIFFLAVSFFVCLSGIPLWFGWMSVTFPLWAWLSILASLILHCILGIFIARVHPRNLLAVLYLPFFFLWKISVYIKMVETKDTHEWIRTAR
jgi:1,2-diacylglycerol 3-beta-glucosyltransferase